MTTDDRVVAFPREAGEAAVQASELDPATTLEALIIHIEQAARAGEHRSGLEAMLLQHAKLFAAVRERNPDQEIALRARVIRTCAGEMAREIDKRIGNGEDPNGVGHLLAHAFWVREAKVNTALPYVVKGIFGKGNIVVLWGAPGSGKSFVQLEMACAIGAGLPWRGRRTKRGIVIYVCAESSRPYVENRVVALKQEWPAAAEADVLIIPLALDLLNERTGDVDRVIATGELLAKEVGEIALS